MNKLIDEGFTKENIKEFIEDMAKDEEKLQKGFLDFAKKQCDDYVDDVSIIGEKIKDLFKSLSS